MINIIKQLNIKNAKVNNILFPVNTKKVKKRNVMNKLVYIINITDLLDLYPDSKSELFVSIFFKIKG